MSPVRYPSLPHSTLFSVMDVTQCCFHLTLTWWSMMSTFFTFKGDMFSPVPSAVVAFPPMSQCSSNEVKRIPEQPLAAHKAPGHRVLNTAAQGRGSHTSKAHQVALSRSQSKVSSWALNSCWNLPSKLGCHLSAQPNLQWWGIWSARWQRRIGSIWYWCARWCIWAHYPKHQSQSRHSHHSFTI